MVDIRAGLEERQHRLLVPPRRRQLHRDAAIARLLVAIHLGAAGVAPGQRVR